MSRKKNNVLKKNKKLHGSTVCESRKNGASKTSDEADVFTGTLAEHLRLGEFSEAFKVASDFIKEFPENCFGWKALGMIYNQFNKLHESEEAFKQAVEVAPKDIEAHSNLGLTQERLGNLNSALLTFKNAVQLNPESPILHYQLANILVKHNALENAKLSVNRAISYKSDFPEARFLLAGILLHTDNPEEAEIQYKKALEFKSDFVEAYFNLAITLVRLGRLSEAETRYIEAIALKSDYLDAYKNLSSLQKDSGKLNEAEITCRKAMEMIPGNSELHFNLAAIFQTQGKLEEAKSLYLSTITLDPNNVEANKNLGTILNRLGNPKESGQFYRRALEINPNYEEVKHLLSAVSGGKTSAAPRQYVETLFDDYSETFEKVLTVDLEYTAPHQIAELLCSNQNKIENLSVLDLGCGTGLVGNEIKKMCSYLVGVDVSNSMLNKAKKKAIYDDLIYGDITDYLKATNLNFDYFIASDVFVYIGDLSQIFYAIKSRNIKPGKLVFSTEHTEGDGFSLEESGRYAHSKKYIQDLCIRFDYQLSFFETIPLRKNESSWISGGLYVLDF